MESIGRLPTFREHFIPDVMPYKLEAGTYVYENVAGMAAAIAYLEDLGARLLDGVSSTSRRARVRRAMDGIAVYERTLSKELIEAVEEVGGGVVHGITDSEHLQERVPTVSFTFSGIDSLAIAEALADKDVGVRSGHMYSPRLITRLGLMPAGTVRASLVHYNTVEEIAQFQVALAGVIDELR